MIGPNLWELTRSVWRNSIDFRWEGSLTANRMNHRFPRVPPQNIPILAQNEAKSREIMRIIYRAVQRLFTEQCGAVMLAALPRLTTARASELRYRSSRQRSAGCNKFSVFNVLDKFILHLGEIVNWGLLKQVSSDIAAGSQKSAGCNKCNYSLFFLYQFYNSFSQRYLPLEAAGSKDQPAATSAIIVTIHPGLKTIWDATLKTTWDVTLKQIVEIKAHIN